VSSSAVPTPSSSAIEQSTVLCCKLYIRFLNYTIAVPSRRSEYFFFLSLKK
jgi:hypothetical protein